MFKDWTDDQLLSFEYFLGGHQDYFTRYAYLDDKYREMYYLFENMKAEINLRNLKNAAKKDSDRS